MHMGGGRAIQYTERHPHHRTQAGADPTVLKKIACQNAGIFYSVTAGTILDTMASYFQVLAPMLSPCKLRWTLYNDYYTGKELLGACLASFELELDKFNPCQPQPLLAPTPTPNLAPAPAPTLTPTPTPTLTCQAHAWPPLSPRARAQPPRVTAASRGSATTATAACPSSWASAAST